MKNESVNIDSLRDKYTKIAEELCYDDKYIDQICYAKTEIEMQRILTTARHEKYK